MRPYKIFRMKHIEFRKDSRRILSGFPQENYEE